MKESECKIDASRYTVIDGEAYDIASFADHHPGGSLVLQGARGKVITHTFKGGAIFLEARSI